MPPEGVVIECSPFTQMNAYECTASGLVCFPNCFRNFPRLTVSKAYATFEIANYDESSKAKPLTTLDRLSNTVDVDELIGELVIAIITIAASSR
jgi:hypothetical protein